MLLDSVELLNGVNNKNEKAWKTFFQSFYVPLCNHSLKIVKEEAIAADIVQETLIRLWDGETKFDSGKALTAYVYHAVTNNSLKYLRNRNVEEEKLKAWHQFEDELSEENFLDIVLEEMVRELRGIIDSLPKERRKIILMSMDGMSGEEIAQALGITIHTVKQQKYRAYKLIRQQLGVYWPLLCFISM